MPKMTLKSIQSQIKALEKKKAALEQAQKAGIPQLKAVISKYKLTKQDVLQAIGGDRKSTRLNSSHVSESRMPSSA